VPASIQRGLAERLAGEQVVAEIDRIEGGIVRWSPEFGQRVKLGLLLRRTDRNDEQTEAVFGGFQGEGCA